MLLLSNIKKTYSTQLILNIPELRPAAGVYWVKGKNGSGKTTLLKIISGAIPFKGSVAFCGIDLLTDPVAYRRQISYTIAEPLYPAFITGIELIKFIQSVRKDSDQHIKSLIEFWGIGGFINDRIETYSSGMVKKLSVAMAFIGNPKLILLDEPLITLEDDALPILFRLIQQKVAEGTSFLFTSHQSFPLSEIPLTGKIIIENKTACLE